MALGSGSGLAWQLQQVDKFNQTVGAEQKITVKPEPEADQTALFTKFQTTSAAGEPPDVSRLKEVWTFESAAKGALANLDGYFKTDKEFNAADFLPRLRATPQFAQALDLLKERGILAAELRAEQVRDVHVGRLLTAGMCLAALDAAATAPPFRPEAKPIARPSPAHAHP